MRMYDRQLVPHRTPSSNLASSLLSKGEATMEKLLRLPTDYVSPLGTLPQTERPSHGDWLHVSFKAYCGRKRKGKAGKDSGMGGFRNASC